MVYRTAPRKKPAILAAVYQGMATTVRFMPELPICRFPSQPSPAIEVSSDLKLSIGKTDLRIAAIALGK